MNELTEDQATLIQIAQMAMGELPRTYTELGHIVWDAFALGRHYEQVKSDAAKDQP